MHDPQVQSLLSLPGISHLTYKDEELIRLSFPKDSIQYVRSFLYLLRAAHGEKGTLGYKYTSSKLTAVIGHRKNIIYITPITDVTYGKNLQELCEKIALKVKCRVLIKKYSSAAYPNMKAIKPVRLKVNELEDGAFPETVLLLSRIFVNKKGDVNPSAKKFLKQLRRFNRLKLNYKIVNEITSAQLPMIEEFLKKDPEKYANYLPIIKYLCLHGKDIKYKTMLFIHNNKVEGLYITEIFSLTEAGLYCAVTSKNKPGITEWMDKLFFQKLFLDGIKVLYFGGSETKGVDYYIKKLFPINPSYYVETIEFYSQKNAPKLAKLSKHLQETFQKNKHLKKTPLRRHISNYGFPFIKDLSVLLLF